MKIRDYRKGDYAGIAEVWRRCFSGTLRPVDSERNVDAIVERGGPFLVAEEGGRIVGTVFAGYDGRQATIHRLAVLPERRRRGIANALMKELMARLEGLKPIEILTHADPEPYVVALYKKLGLSEAKAVYMKRKAY